MKKNIFLAIALVCVAFFFAFFDVVFCIWSTFRLFERISSSRSTLYNLKHVIFSFNFEEKQFFLKFYFQVNDPSWRLFAKCLQGTIFKTSKPRSTAL